MERMQELYACDGSSTTNPDSRRRMFERDKRKARELGFTIKTIQPDEWNAETQGYAIDAGDFPLLKAKLSEGQDSLPTSIQSQADVAFLLHGRMGSLVPKLLHAISLALLENPAFPLRKYLGTAAHKLLLALGTPDPDIGLPLNIDLGPSRRDGRSLPDWLLDTMLLSVIKHRRLRILYRNANGKPTGARVFPLGLMRLDGRWLLVASRRDGATGVYDLHRIIDVYRGTEKTGGSFFDPPAEFNAREAIEKIENGQYKLVTGKGTGESSLHTRLRRKSSSLSIEDEVRIYNFILSYLTVHREARIKDLCFILDLQMKEVEGVLDRLLCCGVYQGYPHVSKLDLDTPGMVSYEPGTVPTFEKFFLLMSYELLVFRLVIKLFMDVVSLLFDYAADVLLKGIISNTMKNQDLDIEYFDKSVVLSGSGIDGFDSFHAISTSVPQSRITVVHSNLEGSTTIMVVPRRIVFTPGGWILLASHPETKRVLELRMEDLILLEQMGPDT
jgi:hypothetical protein